MTNLKIYSSIIAPIFVIFVTSFVISGITTAKALKTDKMAKISFEIGYTKVNREAVLQQFLEKYNSPLANNVDTFIVVADKYGLDYRLLPAISCMESTCGKHMPRNSYNAWGWGVYGNNVIRFKDFDAGIETVGKGLYEGYVKIGFDTPREIAPIYTPPRAGHWLKGVSHFITQMEAISDKIETS